MSKFKIHSIETAPEGSKKSLEGSVKAFGVVHNLHAVLSEAPKALEAYKTLHQLFQQTSFNKEELTVIWQTINIYHECHYCVPGHAAIASMMKVDASITELLKKGEKLPNEKLQVLHKTTLELTEKRGHLSEQQLNHFYDAGYGNQQLLEIVLGLAQKVMSNFTNHLAKTPVDEMFQSFV